MGTPAPSLGRAGYLAICLLTFVIAWENVVVVDQMGTVARIIGWLVAGIAALALLAEGKIRPLHAFHWILIAYFFWGALSHLWSVSPTLSVSYIPRQLQLLVMVLLLWQFGNTAERVRGLCVAYVLGAGVCALLTIYEFTQSADGPYQRWAPEGFNPNNAALIMNLAIPLAWFLLVQSERRLERIAFLIVVVASVAAVILTGSRTGAIVLVVAMTYIFVGAEGKRAKIAAFVIIALTIGFTAQSAPVEIKGRLATIVLAISEGSMANRTTVWQLGLQEWVQVPFQGFGLASFSTVTAETFWGASAHNTFVSITVEQGLIGLLLFLLMIGVILWAIWRLPWATRALVLALFVMLALGLSTITWEMRKQFWLLLSILLMLGRAGIVGRLTPAHPASNRNEVFTLR